MHRSIISAQSNDSQRRWASGLLVALLVMSAQVLVAHPAAAAPAATRISVTVSSTRVLVGESVWVRATVTRSDGRPAAGATVALQRRPYGGSWSTFARRTANASGIAQFPNRPGRSYHYRAVLLEGSERASSPVLTRSVRTADRPLGTREAELTAQLGRPTGKVVTSGSTTWRRYTHGMLVSYGKAGARRTWHVQGKMLSTYLALGGVGGKLGRPVQDIRCSLLEGGCIQRFQRGTLYYSSKVPKVTVAHGSGRWTEHAAVALSQVGYEEPRWRVNKYNSWLGTSVAWCGVFQSWVSEASGNSRAVPHSRSYAALVEAVKKRGRTTSKPAPGRLAFFAYNDSQPRTPTHVGLIIDVLPNGNLVTLEGNTTYSGGFTPERVVAKRTRNPGPVIFYASIY
ncbi:LGFP repeat-containing protein [Sanguibacter sp. HDW7]|uniref:LGFP repeat-containing protein n=1 Tax=Sanguibacter sp. HDW7 TaxID=2714931 RepID=UPI00140DFE06|nr:CHAP domain-containing protein [Sanguibacter sp. HDW7]QIK82860.1 hypothetical protein G7063_03885 [Sanguibacter sp. HDW7]